jgi:hypothetical protein
LIANVESAVGQLSHRPEGSGSLLDQNQPMEAAETLLTAFNTLVVSDQVTHSGWSSHVQQLMPPRSKPRRTKIKPKS